MRLPSFAGKARRLHYQTGRANQASAQPRHGVATNRQAALFAAFSHHHTSPDSRSRCLISSPTSSENADPRRTSLPALPDRARRGDVDINIQQPIHIIDVDVFRQIRGAFGAETPFAGLALSSFWRPASQKSYVAQKAVTPDLQLQPFTATAYSKITHHRHITLLQLCRPFSLAKWMIASSCRWC